MTDKKKIWKISVDVLTIWEGVQGRKFRPSSGIYI